MGRMQQAGMSVRQLARQSGASPAIISRVMRGQRRPPAKHIQTWASALGLSESEQESFIDAAIRDHCEPEIYSIIVELRNEVGQLRKKLTLSRKNP